jgi:hypothetical protein
MRGCFNTGRPCISCVTDLNRWPEDGDGGGNGFQTTETRSTTTTIMLPRFQSESISNSHTIPRANLKYPPFSTRKPSRGLPVEAPNRRRKQNIFLTRAIA